MPVALPDVLVGHDKYVYMRSQTFDLEGNRVEFEAGNRLYYTATDGTLTALH